MDTTTQQRRVLVVEDEADIRDALVEVLDSEGYLATGAPNGREAMQLISGGLRPDLILLDLMMPVMNGGEFVRELNVAGLGGAFSIIVMSADTQTASKSIGLGLDAFVKKPLDLDDLLEMIARTSTSKGAIARDC